MLVKGVGLPVVFGGGTMEKRVTKQAFVGVRDVVLDAVGKLPIAVELSQPLDGLGLGFINGAYRGVGLAVLGQKQAALPFGEFDLSGEELGGLGQSLGALDFGLARCVKLALEENFDVVEHGANASGGRTLVVVVAEALENQTVEVMLGDVELFEKGGSGKLPADGCLVVLALGGNGLEKLAVVGGNFLPQTKNFKIALFRFAEGVNELE